MVSILGLSFSGLDREWKLMSIVAAQRNSVYPNFLFTPLKYPLKTFDQCAGMEVVGHVLLRLQRHWLVTAALSKWWKKYWTVVVGHCLGRM